MSLRTIIGSAVVLLALGRHEPARGQFPIVTPDAGVQRIVVDATGAVGDEAAVLQDAGEWLAECLRQAAGVDVPVVQDSGDGPQILIARAASHSEIAERAGLKSKAYDAYCIVSQPRRLAILGNSASAARHGVAALLRELGFRWFAPSPQWRHIPTIRAATVNLNVVDEPRLSHRGIWYAYAGGEKQLMENYRRWAIANRLSVASVMRTGHSYGNIISRNRAAFDAHPEYFALLPDGQRDNTRAANARKFCFSNPELAKLVADDRRRLLDELMARNPAAYMVSMDPSDGEGTCHCEQCAKLGEPTDRVLHLANHVARHLRDAHPSAWVGLYAYSTHRLPPTRAVEPNVYVQVAMGFNRTQYTLPELIERWSRKVGAIGMREYYGVEAWDWGLPGRMRGSHVSYHRKWIPYYAQRKLNAINAETNANWGGQTLGLYVAAQLMWDPEADVDALVDDFFERGFPTAATPARRLLSQFDKAPPLRAATLKPMYDELLAAWKAQPPSSGAQVDGAESAERKRLVDLMAYLVYVAKFREFDLVRSRRASRDEQYYEALAPLMQYAWQIRMRDVVHYYALARRLCNGLPVKDERPDFYMFHKQRKPVWMKGEQLTDAQVVALFQQWRVKLHGDGDPVVAYSRYLDRVRPPHGDAGPSRQLQGAETGVAVFRNGLVGYLVPSGRQTAELAIAPTSRSATIQVMAGDQVLYDKTFSQSEKLQPASVDLPKANEYRVQFTGSFKLQVPPETPFVFEASVAHPAWIDYSGPHYFYVPRGVRELIVDANPRLSLFLPDQSGRVDVVPAMRQPGKDYAVILVPPGAAGRVWHTSANTRGQFVLLNTPPLLSFHPQTMYVPREVAEADQLTTAE